MTFQGTGYPKETDLRKAIELTVSQFNSGTAGEKADAKFCAIITLYRRKFLPSESRLLDLKKKLHKVFPTQGVLVMPSRSRGKMRSTKSVSCSRRQSLLKISACLPSG